MAQAIDTNFDKAIEEDVILEQIGGVAPSVQTTLKNAENVYKSFLYLRKMYSLFPSKDTILSMATITNSGYGSIVVPEGANYLVVNNYSASISRIRINGMEYAMQPSEKEKFPITAEDSSGSPVISADIIEFDGSVSYIMKNIQEF